MMGKFAFLCLIVSGLIAGIVWLMWRFICHQRTILRRLYQRLVKLEQQMATLKTEKPQITQQTAEPAPLSEQPVHSSISIAKDEPISKYKSVSLPDDIQISFVDKEEQ